MTSMVRGIGDPLVATFTMAYLLRLQSKVGLTTNGVRSGHHHLALLVGALREEEPRTYEKITFSDYLALYKPAIGWAVLLLVRREDESGLVRMFKETQISSNCELVLEAFLQHLPGQLITSHASTIVSTTLATPLPTLVAALGMALVRAGDALPGALDILTKSWAIVTEMTSASDHLPSAAAWLQFAALHFPTRDLNKLVVAAVKRVREGEDWEGKDGALEGLLIGLLARIRGGVMELVRLPSLLPLLALFSGEECRVGVVRRLLEKLTTVEEVVEDKVTIDVLGSLAKTLAGSVSALTSPDEERQISSLISHTICLCSLLPDRQAQLTLLTEKRAAFCHLDLVQASLVRQVNRLAGMQSGGVRRERSLSQALAAFSFITIPSLRSPESRLPLYLETAQTCLLTGCLGQGEACLKAAIHLIGGFNFFGKSLSKFSLTGQSPACLEEKKLAEHLPSLLSSLLPLPDSPDRRPLHLARAALNAVNKFPWSQGPAKALALIEVLRLLSSYCQEEYPYCYGQLPANDQLYGGHPDFIAEVSSMATTMLSLITDHIKFLEQSKQAEATDQVRLQLVLVILLFADLDLAQAQLQQLLGSLLQKLQESKTLAKKDRDKLSRVLPWLASSLHSKTARRLVKSIKM